MEEVETTSGTVTYGRVKMEMEEAIEPVKIEEIYRKMEELSEIVNMLRLEISILMNKVDSLEGNVASLPVIGATTIPEIVIVGEMSKETARQKVLDYMREHKKSDIIELHKNIRCDVRLLAEIIDELRKEGKIEEG
ncbi:MAG: hypothetical protein U9N01_03720 [Euryarchaeota archaeon]|nr:hypothetical protein [Euryarchaeota archaeon]